MKWIVGKWGDSWHHGSKLHVYLDMFANFGTLMVLDLILRGWGYLLHQEAHLNVTSKLRTHFSSLALINVCQVQPVLKVLIG